MKYPKIVVTLVVVSLIAPGCGPCGEFVDILVLRGKVLDINTSQGVTDAVVNALTLTSENRTGFGSTLTAFGETPPSNDGSFELTIFSDTIFNSCGFLPPSPLQLNLLSPTDQVEVTVVRDGCEQKFLIDINEDTVADPDFSDDVIELKDPILVPPCEP